MSLRRSEQRHELVGWLIFVLSALFFMAASAFNRDPIGFVGGVLFLVACLVFLYPLLGKRDRSRSKR